MFTKRSTSGFFMVMAVFNLIVAVIPPIAGVIGVMGMMRDSDIIVNGKQVGPEFDKLVAKEAPLAKIESFAALGGNTLSCLLMLLGSAGLFMGYGFGRWAAVAGAVFMILSLFVHDVYQIFIYRPAITTVFDRIADPLVNFPVQNLPGQQDNPAQNIVRAGVAGVRWGIVVYTCAWSCTNPLLMLYLFAMAMCMAFMTGFYDSGGIDKDGAKPALRGEDDDEDDDEDEDDEEERRPAKKKRKDRGEYEED